VSAEHIKWCDVSCVLRKSLCLVLESTQLSAFSSSSTASNLQIICISNFCWWHFSWKF